MNRAGTCNPGRCSLASLILASRVWPVIALAAMNAPEKIDHVIGDATGLTIPAHADALRAGGEAFLTQAFQTFGALPADNAIARITRLEHCPGGSTGAKLFLDVEYARPDPALHTELFVKFSRDFTDAMRDRQRSEMEPEA